MEKKKYIIGTRASKLALRQVEEFLSALENAGISRNLFEIKTITTKGDQVHHKPLRDIYEEGKSAFTSEIQQALVEGKIDLAVHSTKDIAGNVKIEDLTLASFLPRKSPYDVIISRQKINSFDELNDKYIVGTVSARRGAYIHRLNNKVRVKNLRGNVQTRIEKLKGVYKWTGHNPINYDAIIMAEAALQRSDNELNLSGLHVRKLSKEEMLPAAGQGSIAIECRNSDDELIELIKRINCTTTEREVKTEREVLYQLNGNCHTVIGTLATVNKSLDSIELVIEISEESGDSLFRISEKESFDEAFELARKCSQKLISNIISEKGEMFLKHKLNLYSKI